MQRESWTIVALFAAAFLTVSAGCRPSETVEGQAKDAKITAQIKAKLARDVSAATLTSVDVNVTNGVVTLAGPVHSADESGRIESSARSVEGVTRVQNNLQVLSQAPVVSAAVPTTGPAEFTPIPGATPGLPGTTPTP
jgi:hypothetical protein